MPGHRRALAVLLPLALAAGCRRPLPTTFPEHAALHHRADYAAGGGAALYVGRLQGNEGRAEFLRELDEELGLLREILAAQRRLREQQGPPRDALAVRAELVRLGEDAARVARLVREFLDLGIASRLVEVIPELGEALRLSRGDPPAPGLDEGTLRERQRLLGTGPARCGAEHPDPLGGPHPPPPFFVMARDAVDENGRDVSYDEKQKERFGRILNASKAQRQAMGQYGPFERIDPRKGGETWRFRIGSVTPGDLDYRVRALLIECDFDERGQLAAGRETVIGQGGAPVRL